MAVERTEKVFKIGVKVNVKVIENHLTAFKFKVFSIPVSISVCVQMCECYMVEAYSICLN